MGTDLIYVSPWVIVFTLVGEETEGRREGSEGREGGGRRGRRRKGGKMKEGDKEGRGGEEREHKGTGAAPAVVMVAGLYHSSRFSC